jgi:hypothetical protein
MRTVEKALRAWINATTSRILVAGEIVERTDLRDDGRVRRY